MAIIHEIADAPRDEDTSYTMEPNDTFRGNLGFHDTSNPCIGDDEGGDFIRIDLSAGTTHELNLTGRGFFPVDDSRLYLWDSDGNIVAFHLEGRAGNDHLEGGTGNDRFSGGTGADMKISSMVQAARGWMMGSEKTGLRLEKHRWIAELVPNRTFADIGGLWGTSNETVSIAMRHGAHEATMVDIQPLHSKWWKAFHERCEALGISGYRSVVGDICNDRIADEIGCFDITHCSGIIYHLPSPFHMIRNLISITRERFILTSMVVPDRIENRCGTLELYRGQCLSVPTLSGSQRDILIEHFNQAGIKAGGLNVPSNPPVTSRGRFHYGPWWWLFSAETVVGMCEIFRVDIEKTWGSSYGSFSVLARVDPTS